MYMIERTTAFVWQVASGGLAFVAPLAALTKTAVSTPIAPAKRIARVPTAYPRSKWDEATPGGATGQALAATPQSCVNPGSGGTARPHPAHRGHEQGRDDHGGQELADPADVQEVVRDDAAEQRAGDAEERRLEQRQVLTAGDDQAGEAADQQADQAVPDQRPQHGEREPERPESEGQQEHDHDQGDQCSGHGCTLPSVRTGSCR